MKKFIVLILSIIAANTYAQDPYLAGSIIIGTGVPAGNPSGSPFAKNEGVSFTINAGNASGNMAFPAPTNTPFEVSITTTGMGLPVVTIDNVGSTGNYFAPVIISQQGSNYIISIVQNASIPSGNVTTFIVSGTATGNGGQIVGYQANLDPGGYAGTNAGTDDPSSFGVIDGALPVTLIHFAARAEGETTNLNWSTSTETNSDRFEIERRNDKSWSKIGSVISGKESVSTQNYSYVDVNPLNGENLYRLKMVDRDGSFAYSRIESVTFKLENSVKLFPNPVVNSEKLDIGVKDWSMIRSVRIVNVVGKVVFESGNSVVNGIKTDNLTSGSYVVQVIQKDGKIETRKFVKL